MAKGFLAVYLTLMLNNLNCIRAIIHSIIGAIKRQKIKNKDAILVIFFNHQIGSEYLMYVQIDKSNEGPLQKKDSKNEVNLVTIWQKII